MDNTISVRAASRACEARADVPVPGDYDGDSVTDVAVCSPVTGQWWMLKSSTDYNAANANQWSAPQGVPVPGHYDGDGRTDLAMYQPSTGQWLILQSSTDYATNLTFVLGTGTDAPVPADFDGDGVTDPAVFQRSTGVWRAALSTNGFKATVLATLGVATDVPVAADYDGDRKADLAVFRKGTWQILYSRANYTSGVSLSWGKRSDVPLPVAQIGRPEADDDDLVVGRVTVLDSGAQPWSRVHATYETGAVRTSAVRAATRTSQIAVL
jgi:hypothetical protein